MEYSWLAQCCCFRTMSPCFIYFVLCGYLLVGTQWGPKPNLWGTMLLNECLLPVGAQIIQGKFAASPSHLMHEWYAFNTAADRGLELTRWSHKC